MPLFRPGAGEKAIDPVNRFLCKQPFGPTHHKITGEILLKEIKTHLPFDRKDELLGKAEVRICFRHFNAGHPFYMTEQLKLKWLKQEDVLNIRGKVLYSCKKRSLQEISSEMQEIIDEEPISQMKGVSSASSPIVTQEPVFLSHKKQIFLGQLQARILKK